MLKEQLGSESDSSKAVRKVITVERGVQCEQEEADPSSCSSQQEETEDRFANNPLSDCSTWNLELPNIADVALCSSPDLLRSPQLCHNLQHRVS